jgi:hypothetical protein
LSYRPIDFYGGLLNRRQRITLERLRFNRGFTAI